ncbi:MAG: hypothetical protein HFH87_08230 [Lachnospiraceae bacterium]|nr:hypothetical protein [Lachnospiraceae bacterium]
MRTVSRQIHFSVDDTFGCFQWLHKNYKTVKGIFDSSTFGLAKKLYENYGVSTSFYCMYRNGENLLGDFVSEWQEQFQQCGEWMKFGFHCYDDRSNYSIVSPERIEKDYSNVMNALTRITGGGICFTDTLRLHFFAGNTVTVKYLKKRGINRLLCADDNRGSYNLSENEERELKQQGFYHDPNTGMAYLPTDFRIENINDMKAVNRKVYELPGDTIVLFTHERYLKEIEIRGKLEQFLKMCMRTEVWGI